MLPPQTLRSSERRESHVHEREEGGRQRGERDCPGHDGHVGRA